MLFFQIGSFPVDSYSDDNGNKVQWTGDDIRLAKRMEHKPYAADIASFPSLNTKANSEVLPVRFTDQQSTSKYKYLNCNPFQSDANRSTNVEMLIYNRVPKCASSTMQMILSALSEKNKFEYKASSNYLPKMLTNKEEFFRSHSYHLEGPANASAMDEHFFFVDSVRNHNYPMGTRPNWINMIRDPIERIKSQFHYARHPKRWNLQHDQPSQV